ncbi:hypothetical protein KAR91_77755, partial [Candidatus Pacearchaeota archaeon]|nr:hypothetical protein [Candidatus Pacearchaeota archaeon]
TEAPTITAPAETAVSRMPMPERPAIAEVPGDVETKKPGGYAFGKGGGVTPVPVREAPKPERMGRFVDPTQAYTIGGPRGVGKQDVIGGQDYLDLQKQKEKIMGSIAYRDPDTAKEGAGAQQKLLAISKEMREIRTGVEAGIKDRYGAKTTRGEARSSADAVRSGLEEKQRVRIAEAEQFEIEEARRSQVATAQVAKIGVEAKAAYAGAAPKYDPLDPEGSKAAMAAWEERYRSGGVGAKKAVTEDYTQYK